MKTFFKISTFVLVLLVVGCTKEENLDTSNFLGLGGDSVTKGAIDKWLYDSITKPYNMEVKYRWDPWEVKLDKTLVPPEESKVIPAMSIVKQIWIDPYNAETGSEAFIKKYAPKEFIMVGSPEYDLNGSQVLATAEGGNKIVMFFVNQFDKNDITSLRLMLHIIEHEFAHILHQNILYPQEYKNITPGYTSTWFNFADADAQDMGFISAYAMDKPDEDFAEMVSLMLTEGKARFEEILAAHPDGEAALRRKEQIVVDYFKKAWNIDFYSLQARTQAALQRIAVPQPPSFYIGFDKLYKTGAFSTAAGASFLPASANFLTIYNNSAAALNALGGLGLTLDYIEVNFTTANILSLKIFMFDGTNQYEAIFSYTFTKNASNIYDFTYVTADDNGNFIKSAVQPLLDYFNNNTFQVDWYLDPNVTIYPRVTFIPQQTANATFTALLY